MESGVELATKPTSFTGFIVSSLVFGVIYLFLIFGLNIAEVSKNWPKYRCSPMVMPFASFYGYDTTDNFNFCLQSMFSSTVGNYTAPFGSILGTFTGTLMTMVQNVNSFRLMLATLVGGVTKVFQEITQRFQLLIQQVTTTSFRLKMLMGRVYAVFYSIIYMGLSGMTAASNFGDTVLFKFLDTFCFHPNTLITLKDKRRVPIGSVQIGDVLSSGAKITAKYEILADGQPVVQMPGLRQHIIVSTNHYVRSPKTNKWIRTEDHPHATNKHTWNGGTEQPLICLDTDSHEIEIDGHIFSDYQETHETDRDTMNLVDTMLNSKPPPIKVPDSLHYEPSIVANETVKMADNTEKPIESVQLGERLKTGLVAGRVERIQSDIYEINGSKVSGSALVWNQEQNAWVRAIYYPGSKKLEGTYKTINLLVLNSSIVETGPLCVRDLMEVHSPDIESITADLLLNNRPL
jgi:hypothetical protein